MFSAENLPNILDFLYFRYAGSLYYHPLFIIIPQIIENDNNEDL